MTRSRDRDGIRKLGKGHYRVCVELGKDAEGNRQRAHREVRGTLEAARAVQVELRTQKIKGQLSGRPNQPLSQYLESWLETKRGTVAARTFEGYMIKAEAISAGLGSIRLCDLTTQQINDYYAACRTELAHPARKGSHRPPPESGEDDGPRYLSPTTIHHRHVVLKMALKAAVEDGIILRNPAARATPPRVARKTLHVPDETELVQLLDVTAGTPIEDIVWLALHSGARLGELLALRWRDVDFGRGTIHIRRTLVEHLRREPGGEWFDFKEPKSGSGRAVDLDAESLRRLRRVKSVQTEERLALPDVWREFDLVFPTYCGEPQRPSFVSTRFRRLADSIGLQGVRFHDLRHAHATALLRQMVSPHIVQRRLGHSDPAFTLRVYADVLPGQQQEAADGFAESLRKVRSAG